MTDKQQPEALRLADELEREKWHVPAVVMQAAAEELRRLHAELETLTLYKSLADEYGLSIFPDIAEMTAELENLRAKSKTYEDLGDAADDVQILRMGYAAARLEIESLQSQLHAAKQINAAQFGLLAASIPGSVPQGKGWVVLPGQLPAPGKPVLLDIGKKYPIRAMWVQKFTLEMGVDASDEFGEYDEATDTYYCPEGWYEWNQNEEWHWAVSETPRAWCELPLKDTQ